MRNIPVSDTSPSVLQSSFEVLLLNLHIECDSHIQVDVDDDSSYLFNVAMKDARNFTSVYSGTNVSFTSTDYQDCVADPNCTSQVRMPLSKKLLLPRILRGEFRI